MHIAYLCNIYPAVSHSFVRREIESVERAGHQVSRFSIRPSHSDIKDAADHREAARTIEILEQGWLRLGAATLRMIVAHPLRFLTALSSAWRLSDKGLGQKARHAVYLVEAAWLARRLGQMEVQHLHAHFGTNPATVAALARAWGGPPFSFTVHGPDEFDAPVQLKLRDKAQSATFVAAISYYCRSQLMRWVPEGDWPKLRLVRCGVDADFLEVKPSAPSSQSNEFVAVARLSQQKGLPLLVDACARLRDAGESFHLTIVGYGDMREALESKIRMHALDEHIALAGIRTSSEVRELLLTARAFVLPSFAEGLPIVLMEALALARPVITTAIAGIPELVDDQCGWLIPAGSEADLVDAMISALHSTPEELLAKGMVGRERVLRQHDADQNALHLVDAITSAHSATSERARHDR